MTTARVLGDSVFGNAAELRWRLRGLMMECFFQAEEHWLAWAQRPPPAHDSKCWSVAKTAPAARRLRQWVESFKKGVEVARGGLGSRRWPQAGHLLGVETDLPHNDLEEDQGEWHWCWLAVDWPEDEPDPYHGTSPGSDSLRPRPVLCA